MKQKHQDKCKNLDMKQKLQKIEEMSGFAAENVHKSKITNKAAVKVSCILVAAIVKSAQPF